MKFKVFLGIIAFFIFFSVWLFWQLFFSFGDLKEPLIFVVNPGDNFIKVSNNLKKAGAIKSSFLFEIYLIFRNQTKILKAGTYQILPEMSIAEIVKLLVTGKTINWRLTIPEGFNLKEIENRLKENCLLTFKNIQRNCDFDLKSLKIKDFEEQFSFLKEAPKEAPLEGFLFPDTYELSFDIDSFKVAKTMLSNFEKKVLFKFKSDFQNQEKSLFKIITMASLIEKEVRSFEDKEIVSGILWKRLQARMPLQVDATINYITGKNKFRISFEETKIDNPYNTYLYLGLPPTPISNPGLESIQAALFPKESPYWFYLSTPTGKTI
jgi:UPF0755 protein